MSNQECRDYAALFSRELDRLEGEIEQYSNESKLWAVSGNQKNSAGNLVLHVCGNLMHYIAEGLGQSGYVRDREAEFSECVTRSELIERVRTCKLRVTAVLETLDDSILDETYPAQAPERMGRIRSRTFLLHLIWHLGWHLGQIYYHRLGGSGQTESV
ncbi:MAG: DinB family protein [Gemmatimonadota bacterium]|nr:DinB family protein [Gemmatimonadota bacterium]